MKVFLSRWDGSLIRKAIERSKRCTWPQGVIFGCLIPRCIHTFHTTSDISWEAISITPCMNVADSVNKYTPSDGQYLFYLTALEELELTSVDIIILAFPPCPNDQLTLDNMKPVWQVGPPPCSTATAGYSVHAPFECRCLVRTLKLLLVLPHQLLM